VVQKREEANEVNNVPEIPIYQGNAESAKLLHGYGVEKASLKALELKKKPIVFRSTGVMQSVSLDIRGAAQSHSPECLCWAGSSYLCEQYFL
jgi:hypothetical protein